MQHMRGALVCSTGSAAVHVPVFARAVAMAPTNNTRHVSSLTLVQSNS
jgi:hypothetical protein